MNNNSFLEALNFGAKKFIEENPEVMENLFPAGIELLNRPKVFKPGTKSHIEFMVREFKEQLVKEGKDPNDQSVKAFIRSERKKMKRLKHAGVLDEVLKR